MACLGLTTHTLTGLCARWLQGGVSSSEKLQETAKPQPPQTTCPDRLRHPMHAPYLLLNPEFTFDHAVPHGIPRAVHKRTGRALYKFCLLGGASSTIKLQQKAAKPQPPQTTCPDLLQHPVQASPHLLHTVEAAFDLAVANGMPRAGHSHTGRALCTVVAECCLLHWKSPQTLKPCAKPCRSPQFRLHHTCCTL